MSDEPEHKHPPAPAPEISDDAGSQALSDALKRSYAIVKVVMAGLVVLFLFSGFFTVGQHQKAIILRFGTPVGEGKLYGPGAHWAFPPPIDEVIKIPVAQAQSVESSIGWYATTAAAEAAKQEPPPTESLNPARDGYLLTADENIIHARATLRFRIAEPGLRFALDFINATNAVRHAFNNSLLYAAARYKVDDALTHDQAGFRETALARLERLIAEQGLGIVVEQIENVQLIPPRQLKDAFARVGEAELRRGKEINDARSYENQTISKARAEAEARKNASEAERTRLVEFVAADVERFTNNLPSWRANRMLFMQQRQSETLRIIYTNAQETILAPRGAPGRQNWIEINREPPRPKVLERPERPKDDHH